MKKSSTNTASILIRGHLDKERVARLTGGHARLVDTIAGFPVSEGHLTVVFRDITVCDSFGLELLAALKARPNVTVDISQPSAVLQQAARKEYCVPREADFPHRRDSGMLARTAQRTACALVHL